MASRKVGYRRAAQEFKSCRIVQQSHENAEVQAGEWGWKEVPDRLATDG
jgi:hypothetical protein